MKEILKIEAAGNDFIFFDVSQGVPAPDRIQALCDRHFGIGADGLVIMETIDSTHSRWQFFNNDGSNAAMCGNAARAAGAWLKHEGHSFPHHLETGFGDILLNEHVMSQPHGFTARVPYEKKPLHLKQIPVDHSHQTEGFLTAVLIDTGVPHAVVQLSGSVLQAAINRKDQLRDMASQFRWAKEAGQGGANVTFFSRIEKNVGEMPAIETVTFERGVEDLTLACGTGVLAAAVVASGLSPESHAAWPATGFEVRTPGATLWVESKDFPTSLTLVGPANIVFSLKLVSSR